MLLKCSNSHENFHNFKIYVSAQERVRILGKNNNCANQKLAVILTLQKGNVSPIFKLLSSHDGSWLRAQEFCGTQTLGSVISGQPVAQPGVLNLNRKVLETP